MCSRDEMWKRRVLNYKKLFCNSSALYACLESTAESLNDDDVLGQGYLFNYIPLLEGFVQWVLHLALESNKQRLYFLARDGYQPYLIAKKICESNKLSLECRYLKCSRYSLRIPVYAIDEELVYEYTCLGGIDVSFQKMMRRAGISEDEGKAIAEELGMGADYTKTLSYQQVKALEPGLRRCDSFIQMVRKYANRQYSNAVGYLKQEGLLDNVAYAIVDSGWTGSMQKCLSLLIRNCGKLTEIEGYYFGLYELPEGVNRKAYHTYWFSPENGVRKKIWFSNSLFETVVSAPEGMTISYDCENDKYYAVKGRQENNLNRKLIERYVEILERYLEHRGCRVNLKINDRVIFRLMKQCMCKPTKKEAEAFGTLVFSDDVLEEQTQEIGRVFTKGELREQNVLSRVLIFLRIRKQAIKESAWMEGSIVRSGIHVRWQLFQIRVYKFLIVIKKKMGKKDESDKTETTKVCN